MNAGNVVAFRTSPTNIGISLLSDLAAYDFGYCSATRMMDRTENMFRTLGTMERYRGHFLNWYNTRTLAPLLPRYVSTVDSGNLAGQLLVHATGLRMLTETEIVPRQIFKGLQDTLRILRHETHKQHLAVEQDGRPVIDGRAVRAMDRHIDGLERCAYSLSSVAGLLARLSPDATEFRKLVQGHTELQWWADAFERSCVDHLADLRQLEAWALIPPPPETIWSCGPPEQIQELKNLRLLLDQLDTVPTLREVAMFSESLGAVIRKILVIHTAATLKPQPQNDVTLPPTSDPNQDQHENRSFRVAGVGERQLETLGLPSLRSVQPRPPLGPTSTVQSEPGLMSGESLHWIYQLQTAMQESSQSATEQIRRLEHLAVQCEEFAEMDFAFLHNKSRDLFAIGYNATENRLDASCYDLLASEARLASFILIAQGQLGQEHWFALGRLLTSTGNATALLSWSGSMFEYLMPLLIMPTYENTLLDQTYHTVVRRQIQYGRQRGVPWGISESGYNTVDLHSNYQYRAFGVPGLGLKRGLADDLVIAPYATVLALMVAPEAACKNLERIAADGHHGGYGFYEAIDYTPSRLPPGINKVTVKQVMAHHAGMSLLSLAIDRFAYSNQCRL